ncbi:MAG: HAD-IC family P-type ATPase [Clostridia bacterium]|nr:HAD-IC family P-type ATPase [Clostridia bacterium]
MEMNGLTLEAVQELTRQGKTNQIKKKRGSGTVGIIISNVFTYFNAIFCLLAVLLIMTGSFRNLTFLPAVIANVLIGIVQQIRSKRVLDKLALLDVSEYTAIRDGKEVSVASDQLVLGDVIILESGKQIPADAVVLSGEAGANEALLTGEADEVEKTAGSELKSGSFLISGMVTAKPIRVGADSYAARLTEKAKEVKEARSEMIRDIERIVLVAGIVIIPIGLALMYQSMAVNGNSFQAAVVSMVGAVVGMIPEGLYLLVTVALALSAMRLARNQVLLHDMKSIETLARVDVLCVDKTGTITSDVMSLSELFGAEGETKEELQAAKAVLRDYIESVPDRNITMRALREALPGGKPMEGADVTPFSSRTKYSEVRTERCTYRFGAPEFLLSENQLEAHRRIIEERTGKGQRVLVLTAQGQPILFAVLHNQIRENARDTFEGFAAQGVQIKVISGDNPLTVSKVAGEAGIENADRYVDAATLDTEEKLKAAAMKYTVFGRVNPEQKKTLVEALKENGLKVAMTGDGVNDILAMKEADCSIAMGGGSDAARQAAQVVLLDSDFSRMRGIVSEGRRNINNITRSATLFLYKNIFSVLLALYSILSVFSYPLKPTQVSLISLLNIGVPAFLLALEPNEKKQQGRFLASVLQGAIPAALTSFVAIAAMVRFSGLFNISAEDVSTAGTYLLSAGGFMILWKITRPINRWRAAVFVLCIAGFIFCDTFLYRFFDLPALSAHAAALCAVFAIAQVTILRFFTDLLKWGVQQAHRFKKEKNPVH